MRTVLLSLAASSVLFGACSASNTPASTSSAASATPSSASDDALAAALVHTDRLASDRAIDARRKPDKVLAFFGIKPGMTVLDMFSGGGYYSELMSFVVSASGTIHAHNNTPYLKFVEKELTQRFTPGRLPNVKRFTAENNLLDLPADTFDAAVLILTYHDVYHVAPQHGWEKIDGPKMLAEIFQSMKSGAVLGVVDHAAIDGAPAEVGESLHRIDPERAKREIAEAGFVFEAESDVLRVPDDPRTATAFAKDMRGKTDRFVFRFRKP